MAKNKYKTNCQAVEDAIDWLIDNKKTIVSEMNKEQSGIFTVNFDFHPSEPERCYSAHVIVETKTWENL